MGDVNGDGYKDIGVVGYNSTLGARVYLFGGSASFDTIPDWITDDATAGPGTGLALCGGDINGDGYSDVILEAAGKVYVYYGKPGWPNTAYDLRYLGRLYEGAT
ncbi:MAG: FG-GAP repeat domain-containing protein, partial [Desulfocucumaceae bacterium]